MPPTGSSAAVQERRRFPRGFLPPRVAINLIQSDRSLNADYLNVSEGGVCLRVQEELAVGSLVQFQFSPHRPREAVRRGEHRAAWFSGQRPLQCRGRVAWVTQRMDLRGIPPFVFDVGVEFVQRSARFPGLLSRGPSEAAVPHQPSAHRKAFAPTLVRNRCFIPRLERTTDAAWRWHLIVSVDGTPCFSERYPSEREALAGWVRFRRHQAVLLRRPRQSIGARKGAGKRWGMSGVPGKPR